MTGEWARTSGDDDDGGSLSDGVDDTAAVAAASASTAVPSAAAFCVGSGDLGSVHAAAFAGACVSAAQLLKLRVLL